MLFFSPRCFSENKFKVSFLKAMGRVCSELLRTFSLSNRVSCRLLCC